jgi:hypothetical protein
MPFMVCMHTLLEFVLSQDIKACQSELPSGHNSEVGCVKWESHIISVAANGQPGGKEVDYMEEWEQTLDYIP